MAKKHETRRRAKGGKVVEMNAKGSEEMADAKDKKDEFKRGGGVKRASGGRVEHSPYSSAKSLSSREGSKRTGHENE